MAKAAPKVALIWEDLPAESWRGSSAQVSKVMTRRGDAFLSHWVWNVFNGPSGRAPCRVSAKARVDKELLRLGYLLEGDASNGAAGAMASEDAARPARGPEGW